MTDPPPVVTEADLRPPKELGGYLARRLQAAGLNDALVRAHLLAGTLGDQPGIGPRMLARILYQFTTLPVSEPPPIGGARPGGGGVSFGPGSVQRKVRLANANRDWLVQQCDARRKLPRAELVRRSVALLVAVAEARPPEVDRMALPANPSDASEVLCVGVRFPNEQWRSLVWLFGRLRTNSPPQVMHAAIDYARRHPELGELLELPVERLGDAFANPF